MHITDFTFSPTILAVTKGSTVTWINGDTFDHSIVATDLTFHSDNIGHDGTFQHTFDEDGEFSYVCGIHPQMHGNSDRHRLDSAGSDHGEVGPDLFASTNGYRSPSRGECRHQTQAASRDGGRRWVAQTGGTGRCHRAPIGARCRLAGRVRR